jgi:hypothetical protein
MGKQLNKEIKKKRRLNYVKRKKAIVHAKQAAAKAA